MPQPCGTSQHTHPSGVGDAVGVTVGVDVDVGVRVIVGVLVGVDVGPGGCRSIIRIHQP